MSWKRNTLLSVFMALTAVLVTAGVAMAQASSSYKVEEYHFGSGGQICDPGVSGNSSSYCASMSVGDAAVGNTSSDNYQAYAGWNTTSDPVLEVAVNGSVDLGVLSPNSTATGTANVQVRTYLASGYSMIVAGPSPTQSTASLDPMNPPTTSQTGTEQFGINLRANSVPNLGADPVQVPDTSFSYGVPTGDYNTPDSFKYLDGDTIAYSDKSSGQTNYTLSMIANIAANTPAGVYTTDLSIVVVSVF